MNGPHRHPAVAGGVIVAMLIACVPLPARADEDVVRCESQNGRYRSCRVETDNRVTLTRQLSRQRCVLWSTWGYDRRGVWVDNGCRAEFRAGRDGLSGGQAAAIGAIAGAVILGAVIANKAGKDNDTDKDRSRDLPAWANGTYRGYDRGWNGDIQLTVYSGSAVEGFIVGRDADRFTGRFEKDRLFLGPDEFKVKQDGDGFVARHIRDSDREIRFRRVE
jgi:hypothetical protein